MKNLLLLFAITTSLISFGQTSVISLRSHAGAITDVMVEPDNFGGRVDEHRPDRLEVPIARNFIHVDTVLLFGDCMVERGESTLNGDRVARTVCDNLALKQHGYNLAAVKTNYPKNVVFIGFPETIIQKRDPNAGGGFGVGSPSKNGMQGILAFVLLSILAFVFFPFLKKSH